MIITLPYVIKLATIAAYNETLNLKDKRVYISFWSKSLGDTIAWMSYCQEFRLKHGCELIVSTFRDYLFIDQYPNIQFVDPGRVTPAFVLRKSADSFRLHPLSQGDYVTLSKAYRNVAAQNGWLVTWDQKLKDHPERAKLFGAANIELWSALERRMNEDSSKEESVTSTGRSRRRLRWPST